MNLLLSAGRLAAKDLRVEFRTRSAFFSATVFALLGATIFFFAWDPTAVAASLLRFGWVVFMPMSRAGTAT